MRVIITLDSQKRDSFAALLVAKSIRDFLKNRLEVEIFIAQTSSDISRISLCCQKSIVIHNYSRPVNAWLIEKLKACGSLNYVLDTEGCPIWMFSSIGIQSHVFTKNLDGYFSWGEYQSEIISKLKPKTRVIRCGSIRHQRLKLSSNDIDENCLILTSSPAVNPKLVSIEENRNIIHRGLKGLPEREIDLMLEEQKKNSKRIQDILRILPKKFRKITLRVHPFESSIPYEKIFKGEKNVFLSNEIDIFSDISKSTLVIHGYSTAGVEAVLSGKKVFTVAQSNNLPDWIKKYFKLISIGSKVITTENLEEIIGQKNKNVFLSKEDKEKLDYYYGTNLSVEKSLEKINKEIYEQLLNIKVNFKENLKRMTLAILLKIRFFIMKSPKPNAKKLISTDTLQKIALEEGIDVKLIEIVRKGGIWQVF